MPRKLMFIVEAARGKESEMCKRSGHTYRDQSQCAVVTFVGVELVAPVQSESGKRSHPAFGKAITISAEWDNANIFLIPLFAAHEIELPVDIPEGPSGISVSRKLQHGILRILDKDVEATGKRVFFSGHGANFVQAASQDTSPGLGFQ